MEPIRLDLAALETLDVPVLAVDDQLRILSVNAAGHSLLHEDVVGRNLQYLFPDEDAWKEIKRQLAVRESNKASAYEVLAKRPFDGRAIPVSIYAIPAVD